MSFNEFVLATESTATEFDTFFNQCVAFAEASYQEYKTNLKEAELKVIQESGTPEDLIYLENAAKEGFIVRAGKTVKKLVTTFVEWLKKLVTSIKEFIENKTNKEALSKAEKVVKNNPKLKNAKIEIDDVDKIEKVCGKNGSRVDRKIALFKAKKFSSNDMNELDEIQKDFEKEMSTAKKVTISVTIAAAIAMIATLTGKLSKQERDAAHMQVPEIDENTNPEDINAITGAESLKVAIEKEKANSVTSIIKQIYAGIKGKITGSGEVDLEIGKTRKKDETTETKKDENDNINESTYLDNLISEIEASAIPVVTNESAENNEEFNAEAYLNVLESEVITESDNTDNSIDPQEYLESLENELQSEDEQEVVEMSAEEYLESMESELFNDQDDQEVVEMTAEEYLESLENELFDNDEEEVVEMTAEEYLEEMVSDLFE